MVKEADALQREQADARAEATRTGAEWVRAGRGLYHRSALGLAKWKYGRRTYAEAAEKALGKSDAEFAHVDRVMFNRKALGLAPPGRTARAAARPAKAAAVATRPSKGSAARRAPRTDASFSHLVGGHVDPKAAAADVKAVQIIEAGKKRRGEGAKPHALQGLAARIIAAGKKARGEI